MTKKWMDGHDKEMSTLFFTPYATDEILAEVAYYNDLGWTYTCHELGALYVCLTSKSLDEAKEEVERLILEFYSDQIAYYKYRINRFLGNEN